MKQFSPSYLIQSAYNAAANEVARQMMFAKYGVPVRGGAMNRECNLLVKHGKAVPTRERFSEIFKSLCIRHCIVFEGGIDAFLQGAWDMASNPNN